VAAASSLADEDAEHKRVQTRFVAIVYCARPTMRLFKDWQFVSEVLYRPEI
jgi:hypothetical protein